MDNIHKIPWIKGTAADSYRLNPCLAPDCPNCSNRLVAAAFSGAVPGDSYKYMKLKFSSSPTQSVVSILLF